VKTISPSQLTGHQFYSIRYKHFNGAVGRLQSIRKKELRVENEFNFIIS